MVRNRFNMLQLMIFLIVPFALLPLEAGAQVEYFPFGPQTNVPIQTVTDGGWTECYRDTYDNFMNAEKVLALCPGDLLILSCKPTGSDTLTLLAAGARSDVTFDTGNNEDVTHIANGVGWYFNISGFGQTNSGQNAWGFVRAGDSVNKNNCDTNASGANDERLCWHIQRTNGGYRCGVTEDLNGSTEFERIVYTDNGNLTTNIPTLSEWGLIAMAGILGLIGIFVAARRRKAAHS